MKRLLGWALLSWRLHASLRAARLAIAEASSKPIRIRPAVRISIPARPLAANLHPLANGGLSLHFSTIEENL